MVSIQKNLETNLRKKIDKVAKGQQTYLDFWSRLALPNVRDRLLKSQNMVPTPVWDNQNYHGVDGANSMGYGKNGAIIRPIRELYGPTGKFHATNGAMGAMASIYDSANNNDQVLLYGNRFNITIWYFSIYT